MITLGRFALFVTLSFLVGCGGFSYEGSWTGSAAALFDDGNPPNGQAGQFQPGDKLLYSASFSLAEAADKKLTGSGTLTVSGAESQTVTIDPTNFDPASFTLTADAGDPDRLKQFTVAGDSGCQFSGDLVLSEEVLTGTLDSPDGGACDGFQALELEIKYQR